LVSLTLLIFSLLFGGFRKIEEAGNLRVLAGEISLQIEQYNTLFQQTMLEGFKSASFQTSEQSSTEKTLDSLRQLLHLSIEEVKSIQGISRTDLLEKTDTLRVYFFRYDSLRLNVCDLLRRRGFKDYGDEGALRKTIHALEKQSASFEKAEVLMLRRVEKDFMLRKETSYVDMFNETIEKMLMRLPADSLSGTDASLLFAYQKSFNRLAETEKAIGFNNQQGLRLEVEYLKSGMNPLLHSIKAAALDAEQRIKSFTWTTAILLVCAQVVASIVLVWYISSLFSRRIVHLQLAMEQMAGGSFPASLPIEGSDELDKASDDFNYLVKRVEAATNFATDLGNGNLHVQYNDAYGRDVLANAVIGMQQKLLQAAEQQAKLNWINKSLAEFAEVISISSNSSKSDLAEQVLKAILRTLDMPVGAMYLVDSSNPNNIELQLASIIAFGRKKYLEGTLLAGEGLVGQCYLEKESIILTQIPEDYLNITSGLGEAKPTFVAIIPMMYQSEIIGVLELASFSALEKHERDFLHEASHRAASVFAAFKFSFAVEKQQEY
jgi:hypothetical protein